MSGPGETSAATQSRIDFGSKRTLQRTAFRLCGISLLILWPWMVGSRPLATALGLLATFGAAASIFCAFVAVALREPFARGGLSHWDEALAYVALTRIVHLVQSSLG